MIIKKDKNEELEKILERKMIDEQAKNLLQGILYKIEASYKDYSKVKTRKQTQQQYVSELLKNIEKRCEKIKIVKPSQKLANEEIQKELDKNKFYVGEEIVSYPIEEKILYAIEKKSRSPKILNNKYEEATIAISDLINSGKNMDRTEILRDFNGWSWTTINKEIENIEANLIYQTLQIILSEEFLNNWCDDKDGIIDYLEELSEEMTQKYGEKIAQKEKEILIKISIASAIKNNEIFAQNIEDKIHKIEEEVENYQNTQQKIVQISDKNKKLFQELKDIEKILGQNTILKAEYVKLNEEAPIDKKIFNIKVFVRQLEKKKQQLLEEIQKNKYLLNPTNYIEEKSKLIEKKDKLQNMQLYQEQLEKLIIEFLQIFLKCFRIIIKNENNEEEIFKLMYKFRYFLLLPFNLEKNIKDVEALQKSILDTEKKLVEKAIEKKVIAEVPFEVMRHVLQTRIIKLEDLFYKVTKNEEKYYVQIFDDNISEEKFEIELTEKTKINKKIRIFI